MGKDYDGEGASFREAVKARDAENEFDALPTLPFEKAERIDMDMRHMLSAGVWAANYKRAFRGCLREKPPRNQRQVITQMQEAVFADADRLGLGPKDSFETMLDTLCKTHMHSIREDVVEFLIEQSKLKSTDAVDKKTSMCEKLVRKMIRGQMEDMVGGISKALYDRYSRGADIDMSDVDLSPEDRARLEAEKREKLRAAADERRRQAERFQAEAAAAQADEEKRQLGVQRRVEEHRAMQQGGVTGGGAVAATATEAASPAAPVSVAPPAAAGDDAMLFGDVDVASPVAAPAVAPAAAETADPNLDFI